MFQVITFSLTLAPSVITLSNVVPSGTVSLTDVIASILLLFVTVIVYEIIEPFLIISSSDEYVFLDSITGFTVSGVSFPSTTAVFFISPSSVFTITVKETVFEDSAGTFTFHVILPFSTFPSSEIAVVSSKVVPTGTLSVIVTFVASTSLLVFDTVILYVILLPF